MNGIIIKGVGGFYEVESDGKIYTCRAKGIFRREKIKPLVGDRVSIECPENAENDSSITDIFPRKNELIRPAVSNVDLAMVVFSVRKPDPGLFLLDQYLITMMQRNVPAVIVWNKTDLTPASGNILEEYEKIYRRAGYRALFTSTVNGEGIKELKNFIQGKTVVLAGPSGVGKSSLTNLLCPEASMVTGSISRKIERGKQTTRHSEFFCLGENTYLCDTPGFASVTPELFTADSLREFFPEILELEGKCRFTGCRHLSEPGCAVKKAVEEGTIPKSRYESYIRLLKENSERRRYT